MEKDMMLTSRQVRARFGGISDMTLWRWAGSPKLGFPKPLVIRRRKFFKLSEIEAFEARQRPAETADA